MEGRPLATTKKPASPRGVPKEEAATCDEIVAAIEGLPDEDWLRLKKFAAYRMAGLPREQRKGRTGEDLLREAVARLATGERRWRKSVFFFVFLRGAMRSISTAWREEANPDLAIPFSELPAARDGTLFDPPEAASDGAPDPIRSLEGAETLTAIRLHFAADDLMPLVIDGLGEGMTIAEIAALLEVDQKKIEAAVKKLRRHARELFPDWRTP